MPSALNVHRSYHAPFTVPDEQLEHYGRIYCSAPRRMTFERFLAIHLGFPGVQREARAPVEYVLSAKERQAFAKALERSVRVVDNGHFTEKLTHHRWPRSAKRDFVPGAK